MLNLETIKKLRSDKIGYFRFKRLNEKYLITNDIGKYSFLSQEEFNDFIVGNLGSGEKYEELLIKGFIKREKYEKEMSLKYREKNRFLSYGPTLHIIVTTLRCNHKCRYCHAAVAPMTAKNLDMTIDTARKTVDTIFYTSSPKITIEFQGGESLVNWEVVKYVLEYANIKAQHLGKEVVFALVTNLTLMDEEKLKYLLDNNVQISTSLDGDEDTHNYNRTFKEGNSYENVTYWIKRINEEYVKRGIDTKIGALLTVTKKTLDRYKEVIDTYVELGLDGIFLRPLNPYGFAAGDLEKLGYSSEEFVEFYKKSLDYILELNKSGKRFREQLTGIYLLKIFKDEDPNYLDNRSPCGACIGQVAYNYDGKVYSCDEGRMLGRMSDESFLMTPMLDTGKDTYNAMMNSETTKIMVQASTLDGLPGYNESVYKPYVGVCPIHSYKTHGNIVPNYGIDHKRIMDYAILDEIFTKIGKEEELEIMKGWIGEGLDGIKEC